MIKTYLCSLVTRGIFNDVFVLILSVGHMYDDINASFGWWSMKLHEDFQTISLLMKLYINLDNILLISHMIEEVPNLKMFITPYFWSGAYNLIGHIEA